MAYVNNFQVNLIENSKKPSIKEIPQVTVNIIADIGFLIALSYFVGAGAFTTICIFRTHTDTVFENIRTVISELSGH